MLLLRILIALFMMAGLARAEGAHVITSAFATYGDYSDYRSSVEFAGYETCSVRNLHLFTAGYADLRISHDGWSYRQKLVSAGASIELRHHWRIKFYSSQAAAEYNDRFSSLYDYHDLATVSSIELLHFMSGFTLGAAYTRFDGYGHFTTFSPDSDQYLIAHQYTGRVTKSLSRRFSVMLRPNFVWLTDGRHLLSASARVIYQPASNWVFKLGGMSGERAFYYDNDLLVLFNQTETQHYAGFAEVETHVWKGFWLSAEYLRTRFSGYTISYAVAGLKSAVEF